MGRGPDTAAPPGTGSDPGSGSGSGSGHPAGDAARARGLVVIGGLPGAGKTTLLSSWLGTDLPGVAALDSEQVTAALRDAGVRLPYRLLRPVVHGWHRLRVTCALYGGTPVVVLTDPLTSRRRRTALLRAARRAGRPVRLVLLDATPQEALGGQAARGRRLSTAAMRRHTDRWASFLHLVEASGGVPGARETVVVDRAGADRMTVRDVLGPFGPADPVPPRSPAVPTVRPAVVAGAGDAAAASTGAVGG